MSRPLLSVLSVIVCLGFPKPVYAFDDRNYNAVTVGNTAVETSIYSVTVPANSLTNARGIRIVIWGTYTQNQAAVTRTLTMRLKYGTVPTTLFTKASPAINTSATVANVWAEFVIYNNFTTNAQKGAGRFVIQRTGATTYYILANGTSAIDSTADQLLDVTIQHSNANANVTFTKSIAIASLL